MEVLLLLVSPTFRIEVLSSSPTKFDVVSSAATNDVDAILNGAGSKFGIPVLVKALEEEDEESFEGSSLIRAPDDRKEEEEENDDILSK